MMSPEEKADMVAAQGGKCFCCMKEFDGTHDTCVDHCHLTNIVRGILCKRCNQAIGLARDSPEVLRNMAAYLERFTAQWPIYLDTLPKQDKKAEWVSWRDRA